jgi:hypothetical protein
MSNLYTRVRYDAEMQPNLAKLATDANVLVMDKSVKESNNSCYASNGAGNSASHLVRPMNGSNLNLGQKVEVENFVMNRNKELNDEKGRTNKDYEKNNGNVPSECNVKETLTNENSRYTNPIVDYREMYTAPYNFVPYMFIDYQKTLASNEKQMMPNRYGESSRYVSKEAKYSFTPKQFATTATKVNYNDLVNGLLPNVNNPTITPPYI